ncbi:apolipoprotein N-acyltransferase [Candidatus Darwinibacter acetoxidans]
MKRKALFYLLPLLSGVALIPAFPPLEQGWLAWFALMPLLYFCLHAGPRQALGGAFLFGLPLHLYLNLYLSRVLFTYLPPGLAVTAMILLIALLCCFCALFTVFASCLRRLQSPLLLAAAIPALWVLVEYIRSLGFIGYTVGYLGYTQWSCPFILNILAASGYWGLSFVMVFFQSILLLALEKRLRGKKLAAAAAIFLALFCGGIFLPGLAQVEMEEAPILAALVQGCGTPEEKLTSSGREKILQRYLELTRAAVEEEPRVELILWPETVVNLKMKDGAPQHRREMVRLAEELGVSILYGAQLYAEEALYNSMILLAPGQGQTQLYHKRRLVPFVEYFPLEDLLNRILNLESGIILGSYTPGEEITIFNYRGLPLAGVICFESYFGDYTRLFARRGGRHLFIATNDAWFGRSIGLEQHAQAAALRAAEMGIGVTQVANSGISISFDYRGRELLRTGKEEQGFHILPLDLARRATFYRWAGDFVPPLCLLLLAGCAVQAARGARCPLQLPAGSRRRQSR